MTDRRPDVADDPLPARLEAWFEREVHQAGADLRATPLGVARTRGGVRRGPLAPLVAAVVVVIVVVAGLTRLPGLAPGAAPTDSAGPSSTAGTAISTASAVPLGTPLASLPVDARYPDGIPSSLGGRSVARPSNVDTEPAGDVSFLLGGWSFDFGAIAWSCTPVLASPPSFGPRCGTPFLAENPLMDELPRVMLDGWTATIPAGPVVLLVHRNDARAAACAPNMRAACENVAVIEDIVWAGDFTTDTAPLKPTDVFMRLVEADASLPQARLDATFRGIEGCGAGLSCLPPEDLFVVHPPSTTIAPTITHGPPLRSCRPPFPQESWSIEGASIELVLLFPTIAARELVDQNFTASGFIGTTSGGVTCQTITDAFFNHEWIAVQNVMVAVQVNVNGPTAAQTRLIDEVRTALTRP